ncbi:MAG TPA: rhomboid family intramembrane serine protease [Flavobacterium sp.]|nr:rhomboid family intramembrane serine protease [Flavobacterium sp.]
MKEEQFEFSSKVIILPFMFILMLWVIFWADLRFHLHLYNFGIYPRSFEGFRGVFFSPFIHGSLEHLYNNSIPLLILISALLYFYKEQSLKVLGYGILFSGLITWIIGRESHHIGASSLIYVLVSFIFFKGIMTKYYRLVTLSLTVVLIYGSMVWYIFPDVEEGISWEGHLAGFISGFVFALLFKTPEYKKNIRYEWEHPDFNAQEDKFMQRFDENGNFVNKPIIEIEEDQSSLNSTTDFKVIYEFKKNESNE